MSEIAESHGTGGSGADEPTLGDLADDLRARNVRRVHVLAWRDLDDPDAGGSEVHADHFMRRWSEAGLDVLHRTSHARDHADEDVRNGYRVIRRGGRMSVFPRTAVSEVLGRMGRYDALVEVWNGVPWMSPLWCRRPNITFIHHVHGPMWDQVLPGPMAAVGRIVEASVAPPFYRRTRVVTPSDSTRGELLGLGFRAEMVTAVNNGIDAEFCIGERKAAEPTVVCVARMAPVKRHHLLIDAAVEARRAVPDLRLVLVGDGPTRPALEAHVRAHQASEWVTFTGHLDRRQLVEHYQRAWIVASASLAEGWGLSMTEAAACGTPAVATDINGHRSSVVDGVTGDLVPVERLGTAIAGILADHDRRRRLADAAVRRAATLTWDASALGLLRVLHAEVVRRQG
ncbi:MAG: glycosyltransferase family 4 protein [Ilumatobacteraceae bacterium]